MIDICTGQSEVCTRPLAIKTVGQHFINLSFYFTGTIP